MIAGTLIWLGIILEKTSSKELGSVYVIMKESSIVPWFDAKYSKLVDKMKQAKLQWLQDPSQIHII
jgi:hypothetical protein